MKSSEINIDDFTSINELYSFIDTHALEIVNNWDLSNLLLKYKNKTTVDSEKSIIQWEVDSFLFEFKDNKLFSFSYSSQLENKYPNLDIFEKEAFDYLICRAKEAKNHLLLSRYNHLLWKAPKGIKNKKYGVLAIENYIKAIYEYIALLPKDSNSEYAFQIGQLYENAVGLSSELKESIEPIKELTKHLLFKVDGLEFYVKHGVVEDMLEHTKVFKQTDFIGVLEIYENEINKNLEKADDFNLANYHLPSAVKVAQRLNSDINKWHTEIGKAYVRIAEREIKEDRFWIKLNHLAHAIRSFMNAGNIDEKEKAEHLYFELKPKVHLNNVKIDFDAEVIQKLEEYNSYIKQHVENLLKLEPNAIYSFISKGMFFPKKADVLAAENNQKNTFLNFATTIEFDKNKNISFDDKSENKSQFFDTYSYSIDNTALHYMYYIFTKGIKSGHLTFDNFISYISKSWIGKPYFKLDMGGEQVEVNWIGLIAPSIVEFFVQVQSWVNSKYYKPNLVLCIDSLVLKIEGLFRDFSERVSIPTSVGRKKGIQEVYLHNVLDNSNFLEYFNDDDILLFNYIFSSESKLNLRNNIAHCFLKSNEYGIDKMFLLLAALLRLAKYEYKENHNS